MAEKSPPNWKSGPQNGILAALCQYFPFRRAFFGHLGFGAIFHFISHASGILHPQFLLKAWNPILDLFYLFWIFGPAAQNGNRKRRAGFPFPKEPSRTENTTAPESVVFCYRCSSSLSVHRFRACFCLEKQAFLSPPRSVCYFRADCTSRTEMHSP